MGRLLDWFLTWFTGEPAEYRSCPSKHANLVGRMKWTEEVVEFYQECDDCGKEFYAED